MRKMVQAGAVALAVVAGLGGAALWAQGMGHGNGLHRHNMGQHDMTGMPGLQGLDATQEESDELAIMFNNFDTLSREVEMIENGIRTVTRSSDREVMAALISHVSGMINRVEEARDPRIFIQSPTLDILFERGATMTNDIEVTDAGIVVTQTSTDPEVVAALQTHAGEVSAMADRGMDAVHEMMMNR